VLFFQASTPEPVKPSRACVRLGPVLKVAPPGVKVALVNAYSWGRFCTNSELLALEDTLFPAALVANTVNVYVCRLVNPVTVIEPDAAPDTVPVIPPGLLTAV
jgi:hypothetical protein